MSVNPSTKYWLTLPGLGRVVKQPARTEGQIRQAISDVMDSYISGFYEGCEENIFIDLSKKLNLIGE